mgnify:CR=1 FL=1
MKIQGNIVDIFNKQVFKGEITVENNRIKSIEKSIHEKECFIIPGFVDAHIHIESSMLIPSEFSKIAVTHGTVATVSDPHEIANVLGVKGVEFMIDNGKTVPLKFNFGAPSCVPATNFETAGAVINAYDTQQLLQNPEIKYLAEMMNYPGVLSDNTEVFSKIAHAKKLNKPIDGHAPNVRGKNLDKYIAAGISTDHECFTFEEALEKLQKGMKIIIREGSAAKNFDALIDLLSEHFENMMFCSDDKHPDDLLVGHINKLCKRAVAKGIDVFKVLHAACVNPVKHYNLDVGLLRENDFADFVVVDNLEDFNVLETYIDGVLVAKNKKSFIKTSGTELLNNFNIAPKSVLDFQCILQARKVNCIEVLDGELITNAIEVTTLNDHGNLVSNTKTDVLKISVVNRYQNKKPAIGFIKNFGLQKGAIASSVAHDCHNIVVVGVSDTDICDAVNLIIENKGGICAVTDEKKVILPLPIAGIMSDKPAKQIGEEYAVLEKFAKGLGCKLKAPYMSLSFMALLVIPSLKLSDKGLFDGNAFEFISIDAD